MDKLSDELLEVIGALPVQAAGGPSSEPAAS
jgi:hypothetical protein